MTKTKRSKKPKKKKNGQTLRYSPRAAKSTPPSPVNGVNRSKIGPLIVSLSAAAPFSPPTPTPTPLVLRTPSGPRHIIQRLSWRCVLWSKGAAVVVIFPFLERGGRGSSGNSEERRSIFFLKGVFFLQGPCCLAHGDDDDDGDDDNDVMVGWACRILKLGVNAAVVAVAAAAAGVVVRGGGDGVLPVLVGYWG